MHTKTNTARKRWWRELHCSLRTLMTILAAVCVYFGSWQLTGDHGVAGVADVTGRTGRAIAPFIVTVSTSNHIQVTQKYQAWFLGPILRLPVQRQFAEPNPVVMGGVQPLIIVQPEDENALGVTVW